MASKPEDEHAYILDSFEEFEALARRALHEGNKQEQHSIELVYSFSIYNLDPNTEYIV